MKSNRRHATFIILAIIAFLFTSLIPSFAEVINYTYDDAGRLRRAEYVTQNRSINYACHEVGTCVVPMHLPLPRKPFSF